MSRTGQLSRQQDHAARDVLTREWGANYSIADLHYRLGKAVEDRPGVLHITGGPKHNTDKRLFDGAYLDCHPNMDCANRLQEFAAEARERMGEARWAELNAEWDDSQSMAGSV